VEDPKSSIEHYLDHLDGLFGKGDCRKVTDETERPHVWVVGYRDVPDPGSLAGFTYGLSSIEHRDWKLGRPELLISVNSPNLDWALAAGFLAKKYRGLCPFSIGNVLRFGSRITSESEMSAFFVFAPSLLTPEEAAIVLPDRRINIVQLYPIYEEEIELIQREGVGSFFARDNLDLSDVRRPNLGEKRH
jgi:hypothetical protein